MSILRLLPAAVFGPVALMMQVGPKEAASNLSKWVELVTPSPDWLKPIQADVWAQLIFVLLAIASLIWYFWPRIVSAREKLQTTKTNDRNIIAAPQPSFALIPDWPIQELFFHLRPTLRTGNDTAYEATSLEIRDKLSTGQLKIWGWRINHHGERLPQTEIDPTYWQHADFTYAFFFLNGSNEPHTRPNPIDESREYHDLRINKAQALTIWPKSGEDAIQRQHAEYDAAFKEAAFERTRENRRTAVLHLTQLRDEGTTIRNDGILIDDAHLQAWVKRVLGWMEDVIAVIWQIDEADSVWFKTLQDVPAPSIPIVFTCLIDANKIIHEKNYREHAFRLVRLNGLLAKYGVGA